VAARILLVCVQSACLSFTFGLENLGRSVEEALEFELVYCTDVGFLRALAIATLYLQEF
jgi:hypothetical protein